MPKRPNEDPADDEPGLTIPTMLSPEAAANKLAKPKDEDEDKDPAADPRAAEEYEFTLEVREPRGKVWSGKFKNRILTIEERVNIGLTATAMANGIPWRMLDEDTQYLLTALAHLSKSLVEKPRWFVITGEHAMKNTRIISKVYAEVSAHEAYFRGSDAPAKKGEG